jgi:hypothetical protein
MCATHGTFGKIRRDGVGTDSSLDAGLEMQDHIAEFRGWLDGHGASALQSDQSLLIANRSKELSPTEAQ